MSYKIANGVPHLAQQNRKRSSRKVHAVETIAVTRPDFHDVPSASRVDEQARTTCRIQSGPIVSRRARVLRDIFIIPSSPVATLVPDVISEEVVMGSRYGFRWLTGLLMVAMLAAVEIG